MRHFGVAGMWTVNQLITSVQMFHSEVLPLFFFFFFWFVSVMNLLCSSHPAEVFIYLQEPQLVRLWRFASSRPHTAATTTLRSSRFLVPGVLVQSQQCLHLLFSWRVLFHKTTNVKIPKRIPQLQLTVRLQTHQTWIINYMNLTNKTEATLQLKSWLVLTMHPLTL